VVVLTTSWVLTSVVVTVAEPVAIVLGAPVPSMLSYAAIEPNTTVSATNTAETSL